MSVDDLAHAESITRIAARYECMDTPGAGGLLSCGISC
jgi:hypothetical protein